MSQDGKNRDWRLLDEHVRFTRSPDGFTGKNSLIENLFGPRSGQILDDLQIRKIREIWSRAAGPMATHSRPVRIRGKILEVTVEKPIYSQEIQFYKGEILNQLNREGDMNITDLRVKIGKLQWDGNRNQSGAPVKRAVREIEKDVDPDFIRGLQERQKNG